MQALLAWGKHPPLVKHFLNEVNPFDPNLNRYKHKRGAVCRPGFDDKHGTQSKTSLACEAATSCDLFMGNFSSDQPQSLRTLTFPFHSATPLRPNHRAGLLQQLGCDNMQTKPQGTCQNCDYTLTRPLNLYITSASRICISPTMHTIWRNHFLISKGPKLNLVNMVLKSYTSLILLLAPCCTALWTSAAMTHTLPGAASKYFTN